MLVVISPAKKLDMTHSDAVEASLPSFNSKTEELVTVMQALSSDDIGHLMGISANLADLNRERFARFGTQEKKPARYAFAGDTEQGLEAKTLTDDDVVWAQDHLRILSGLYGLLRPLDLMQPYRLEMGTKFKNKKGKNLYEFWDGKLTENLNDLFEEDKKPVLINLAPKEYFSAIKPKSLNAEIISPVFKDFSNGKYKIISFFAKKARGYMASYIIQNKIKNPAKIKDFDVEGYRYSEKDSTPAQPVFLRDPQ